jgi:hypothetical protein
VVVVAMAGVADFMAAAEVSTAVAAVFVEEAASIAGAEVSAVVVVFTVVEEVSVEEAVSMAVAVALVEEALSTATADFGAVVPFMAAARSVVAVVSEETQAFAAVQLIVAHLAPGQAWLIGVE